MENNKNEQSTLEFIHLVKCIIEYYGTTKSKNNVNNDIENTVENEQLDEAEKMLNSISKFNLEGMSIEIPEEIDLAVKTTFLSQLKKFEKYSEFINS